MFSIDMLKRDRSRSGLVGRRGDAGRSLCPDLECQKFQKTFVEREFISVLTNNL